MKRTIRTLFLLLFVLVFPFRSFAAAGAQEHVRGGFEMAGFFNGGFGWQKFEGGPPTQIDYDGAYAGVLGSVLPEVFTGVAPVEGEDILETFVEVFELDIIKQISDRASLRADILFGRGQSGSWVFVPGIGLEQAYATVRLSNSPAIDLTLGRIGTQIGFEPFEPYFNDTISWSILSCAYLYPYIITGAQFQIELTDSIKLFLQVANNFTNDSTIDIDDLPSGIATVQFLWGEDDRKSSLKISPFIGPESGTRSPLTFGADSTLSAWLTDSMQLGVEGLFRRDNGNGGPNTSYAAGLLNLHWDMTESFYGGFRFCFARQFEGGNGILNLTGAKQNIYESSLFAGYYISDGMKLKFETRVDFVDPAVGQLQWVPGVAMALAAAF